MRWVRLGQLTWQYIRVVVGGGGVKGNFIYVFILLKKAQIIANVMLYASKGGGGGVAYIYIYIYIYVLSNNLFVYTCVCFK